MAEPAIRLQDLRFRWPTAKYDILDVLDFSCETGEHLFLRGSSGSGKTTLLNVLGGVAIPQHGSVQILGTNLGSLSHAARDAFRADRIGFVFQQFNLVPYLGLIDNVTLPCRFSSSRQARAERRGSLDAEARRLLSHMQLDEELVANRAVSTLSVGQQQRVAAARALIGAPDLVIADEPTSSIDQQAQGQFLELMFQEISASGATLIFVSHDQALARHFSRVVDLAEINRLVPA